MTKCATPTLSYSTDTHFSGRSAYLRQTRSSPSPGPEDRRMMQSRGTIFIATARLFASALPGRARRSARLDTRGTLREEEFYAAAEEPPCHHALPHGPASSTAFRTEISRDPIWCSARELSHPHPPPPLKGRFELLFAGQVGLRKGFPYLLAAYAALKHPNKRLRVIGSMARGFREVLAGLPQKYVNFL